MTILELSGNKDVTAFAPYYPFVFILKPGFTSYASFWTTTFGAPDDSNSSTAVINSLTQDFITQYDEVTSVNDCISQEKSFYWDNSGQSLYVHIIHEFSELTSIFEIGEAFGFCNGDQVYVDNVQYLPTLLSAPQISQQEDIVNYDQLSFIDGRASVSNGPYTIGGITQGLADFLIEQNVYGNRCFLYYLDDTDVDENNSASRSDLVRIAAFYVEDYDISLKEVDFQLRDIRKTGNVTIPTTFFNDTDYPNIDAELGSVIPLIYGTPREAKAYKTNDATTTGDVTYRVGLTLTSLGTVQVNIDGVWTTKTPTATNLTDGEFTLSSSDGRTLNGAPYDCRVLSPAGIPITYSTDAIKDLNQRYLNIQYIASNYDLAEWESEETDLSTVGDTGIIFDSEIKLYEAIRQIQDGSIVGFRYEILPDGRRTIRIDKNDRALTGTVTPEVIQNRDEMPVTTDSDQVFAKVVIQYAKSWNSNKYKREENEDFRNEVASNYNSLAILTKPTFLTSATDAATRAADYAERFSKIPRIMSLTLKGKEFLDLRIYDRLNVQASPDFVDADAGTITGREFYGLKEGKVIAVSPDLSSVDNEVLFVLQDKA